MTKIWECVVDDGVRQYFDNAFEAEFFAKDTVQAGFGVRTQEIDLPTTAREFADFMNRHFAQLRALILAVRAARETEAAS